MRLPKRMMAITANRKKNFRLRRRDGWTILGHSIDSDNSAPHSYRFHFFRSPRKLTALEEVTTYTLVFQGRLCSGQQVSGRKREGKLAQGQL